MIHTSKVSVLHTLCLITSVLYSASSNASLTSQDEGDQGRSVVLYNPHGNNPSPYDLEDRGIGCDILNVGEALLSCSSAYGSTPCFTKKNTSESACEREEDHPDPSVVSTSSHQTRQSSMNPFGCLPLINPSQIYELARDTFIHLSTSTPEHDYSAVDTVYASMNDGPSIFWPFWSEGCFSPFSVSADKKNQ
ncbi:MAG: hypothetical protein K2X53_00430 [Alphaproteobacteria bacterium]|nr:hypothetical protein [Alphaproteobacteria bacterium]